MSRYRLELGGEVATVVPARVAAELRQIHERELKAARDGGRRFEAETVAVLRELIDQGAGWRNRSMSACPPPMSDGGGGNGHGRTIEPIEGSISSLISSMRVAVVLGVSDRHVRRLARSGVLPGERDGRGVWHFEAAVVDAEARKRER